jgi:hypothetical protein
MSTNTTRLNAVKAASSENVDVTLHLNNNFDLFDAAVGATAASASSRPASAFSGRIWFETDSRRLLVNEAASASTAATWRTAGAFGSGTAVDRQPFSSLQGLSATAAGSADKAGHLLTTVFSGNYGTASGSNPTFGWGLEVFSVTGTSASDAAGGNLQNLIETAVRAPSGTITSVTGLQAEASFYGATASATVTTMRSLRVAAPNRKEGATAGTATNVYGLYVESVVAASTGATTAYSLYVAGGTSRYDGALQAPGQNFEARSGVFGPSGTGTNGRLHVQGDSASTNNILTVKNFAGQVNDPIRLVNSSDVLQFSITAAGLPKWITGNTQTTVGAAGAGSALPATPVRYVKIVDGSGTTLVVPAYNP